MKFEDVENARKAYNDKKSRIKKKAIPICLAVEIVVVVLYVLLNYRSFQNISRIFNSASIAFAMPFIIAAIFMILLPIIIVSIVISLSTKKELLQYKKSYKGYFVGQSLERTFSNVKYNHDAGLDRQALIETGMIYTGDRYSSNDLTVGKYKDVTFAQADVHIEEEYKDDDGNTHYRTIFMGRFMIFEFPKKFNSKLMLTHKSWISHKASKIMKRIETESIEFNKYYSIYAEDGMEAFYILTPDFMERAQELGKTHNDKVSFYFTENKMIVGINDGNDAFEPPNPKNPIDEKTETEKINKEINSVIHIIDSLKLNR